MLISAKKLRKVFLTTGIVVLIIFAILYLPFTQGKLTEILNVNEDLHPSQVIVVLGGGLKPDGSPGISTRERVDYGVFLFKKGLGNYLILSGGDRANNQLEAGQMYKIALGKGIPPEVMIKETRSLNTYENAIYTKKLFYQFGIKGKIILVTSPYHVQRALSCFKKQGFKVSPAPVEKSEIYTYGFYQNFRNLRLLMHEFLALAYYRYYQRI